MDPLQLGVINVLSAGLRHVRRARCADTAWQGCAASPSAGYHSTCNPSTARSHASAAAGSRTGADDAGSVLRILEDIDAQAVGDCTACLWIKPQDNILPWKLGLPKPIDEWRASIVHGC